MNDWTTNGIPASNAQLSVASLYGGGINEQFASQPFDFLRSSTPPSSISDPLVSSSISLNGILQRPLYSPLRTPPPKRARSSNVELIDSSPFGTWPSLTGVLETPDRKHCPDSTARHNLSNIANTMQSFVLTYSPFAKRPCTENAKDRSFDTSNDSGIGRSFNTSADSGIGRSFDTSNNSTIGRPFDNSTDSGIGRSLDTSNNAGIGRSFIDSPPPFKPPSTMIYRTSPILRSPLSASGAINSPLRTFFFKESPCSFAQPPLSLTTTTNSIDFRFSGSHVNKLQSPQPLTTSENRFVESNNLGSMSCSNAVRIKTPRFTARAKSLIYGRTTAQRELTLQAKKFLKRSCRPGYRTSFKLANSREELAKILNLPSPKKNTSYHCNRDNTK